MLILTLSLPLISIHALLAESDARKPSIQVQHLPFLSTLSLRRATNFIGSIISAIVISIHALLAESDARGDNVLGQGPVFLSTLSLRRATTNQTDAKTYQGDFYPRSPCGERHHA